MSKVIAFLPAAGGVGNSTLCAQIAGLIADENNRCLIIDLNMEYRNTDLIIAQSNEVTYNILDVLFKRTSLEQAIAISSQNQFLHILNASWTRPLAAIVKEDFSELIKQVREQYDYVFLDMPNAATNGYELTEGFVDTYLIVTTLDQTSLRNMDKITTTIRRSNRLQDIKLLFNKYREDFVKKGIYQSVDQLKEEYSLPIVGIIPTEDLFIIKHNAKTLLAKEDKSIGAKQLRDSSRRLLGEEVPFTEIKKRKWRQFFENN